MRTFLIASVAVAAIASGETAAALRAELDYWVARRTVAQLVEHDPTPRQAGFGTRVTIKRGSAFEDVYIVGEDESDPINGRLAWNTPLARQLDGANRGDTFTPNRRFELLPVAG